jgi:hypothetical protein
VGSNPEVKKMSEWEKIGQEIIEQRKALGILPVHQITEGENVVEIDLTKLPQKRNTQYGERYQIYLTDDTVLLLSPRSPLMTQLITLILDAIKSGAKTLKVKIVRAGRGRATRYTVVKV